MAVSYDASTVMERESRSSNAYSFSHTASDANIVVIGTLLWGVGTTDHIDGITYGGVAMTELYGTDVNDSNASQRYHMAVHYLVGPPVGAQTVAFSFGGATSDSYMSAVCAGYAGVRGVNGIAELQTGFGYDGTSNVEAVANTQVGGLTVDMIAAISQGAAMALVCENTTTRIDNDATVVAGSGGQGLSESPGTGGSVNMGWSGFNNQAWFHAAFALYPAAGGSQVIWVG